MVQCAKGIGAIISAEEYDVIGGLCNAVAEVLARTLCGVSLDFWYSGLPWRVEVIDNTDYSTKTVI